MRFIGVDLARGGKNPSGLAVLDEDGKVVGEDVLIGGRGLPPSRPLL
jgi:predicted RNase H-like nuclease